jgi:transcription elongation factor Elf1
MVENLEEENIIMNDVYKEYYRLHKYCPNCGSNSITSTLLGYFFKDLKSAKDNNKADCGNCKWIGIVHNLIENNNVKEKK